MMPAIRVSALVCLLLCVPAAAQQSSSILTSKHNLSASGPGSIRASSEQEICIFCHTPHNSSPIQPVWNRNVPVSAYTVYTSNSLNAAPGQPTGSSKLCLSCHDGTIAVGSVLSRDQQIAMAGGQTSIPPGQTNLGTDLSDDHPVSFRYDSALATRNPKLRNPANLPQSIKLDKRQEMQCTTCHDAHSDRFGKFLVMDNSNSQLCTSCHSQGTTAVAGHMQCLSCHQNHTAPSGPHLLRRETVSATCISCHNGSPGPNQGPNVQSELVKIQMHDTNPPVKLAQHAPADVTCNDCHEPHTMLRGSLPTAPGISPKLGKITGVNAAGAQVPVAQFQYEVCFKCHAEGNAVAPTISRQIVQTNARLQFAPAAVSYHPVVAAGKNSFVPSLRPGLSTSSLIYCTDCHNSDTGTTAGGTGTNGPHGSNNPPLLLAQYETTDSTAESANAYALCYRCHDRSSILGDASFSSHKKHIVDLRTPCSVCHDAHGISSAQGTPTNHAKLINFDITVVSPDASGRLMYQSRGPRSGTCYLNCHGREHSPLGYPEDVGKSVDAPANPFQPAPQLPALKRGRR